MPKVQTECLGMENRVCPDYNTIFNVVLFVITPLLPPNILDKVPTPLFPPFF